MSLSIVVLLHFPGFVGKTISFDKVHFQHYHSYDRYLVSYDLGSDYDTAVADFDSHVKLLTETPRQDCMSGASIFQPTLVVRYFDGHLPTYRFRAYLRLALSFDDPLVVSAQPRYHYPDAYVQAAVTHLRSALSLQPTDYSPHTIIGHEFAFQRDRIDALFTYLSLSVKLTLTDFDDIPETKFSLTDFPACDLTIYDTLDRLIVHHKDGERHKFEL